jgi:hypothetical protein
MDRALVFADIFFNDSAAATTPPLPAKASAAALAVGLTKFLGFTIYFSFEINAETFRPHLVSAMP